MWAAVSLSIVLPFLKICPLKRHEHHQGDSQPCKIRAAGAPSIRRILWLPWHTGRNPALSVLIGLVLLCREMERGTKMWEGNKVWLVDTARHQQPTDSKLYSLFLLLLSLSQFILLCRSISLLEKRLTKVFLTSVFLLYPVGSVEWKDIADVKCVIAFVDIGVSCYWLGGASSSPTSWVLSRQIPTQKLPDMKVWRGQTYVKYSLYALNLLFLPCRDKVWLSTT